MDVPLLIQVARRGRGAGGGGSWDGSSRAYGVKAPKVEV